MNKLEQRFKDLKIAIATDSLIWFKKYDRKEEIKKMKLEGVNLFELFEELIKQKFIQRDILSKKRQEKHLENLDNLIEETKEIIEELFKQGETWKN